MRSQRNQQVSSEVGPRRVHPSPTELVRFLRTDLPEPEARAVVRHLLSRCPRCLLATRRLWGVRGTATPERWDLRWRDAIVSEPEAAARAEIRELAAELRAISKRLQEVAADLPVSSRETAMLEEGGEWDVPTELRTAIECVLADHLKPALAELRKAAAHPPRGEGGGRSKEAS